MAKTVKRPFSWAISMASLAKARVIAVLAQGLLDLLGVAAERGLHRPLDGLDEAVAALVPLLDQGLDDLADFAQGLVDVRRVLAAELDHLDGIPDDVVLAQTAWNQNVSMPTRAAADLRVPEEEPGGERLAADLGPAGRVDEEAEHVLLPAVQAGRPVEALGRGLEVVGELLDHGQQVGVVQPRVAGRVDRAELARPG